MAEITIYSGHAGPRTLPAAPSRFSGEIAISDLAAEKLKAVMEAGRKDPAVYALRVGVRGGGCSGLEYVMELDTPKDDDKVFTHPATGVSVLVDPKSLLHVSGSILDYNEGLMGSGFAMKNPQVKSSCGCGHSFST